MQKGFSKRDHSSARQSPGYLFDHCGADLIGWMENGSHCIKNSWTCMKDTNRSRLTWPWFYGCYRGLCCMVLDFGNRGVGAKVLNFSLGIPEKVICAGRIHGEHKWAFCLSERKWVHVYHKYLSTATYNSGVFQDLHNDIFGEDVPFVGLILEFNHYVFVYQAMLLYLRITVISTSTQSRILNLPEVESCCFVKSTAGVAAVIVSVVVVVVSVLVSCCCCKPSMCVSVELLLLLLLLVVGPLTMLCWSFLLWFDGCSGAGSFFAI